MTAWGRRLVLAQGADALSFAGAALVGLPIGAGEQNHLVLAIYAAAGALGVCACKLGGAVLIARGHTRSAHGTWRPLVALLVVATAAGLVGAGFNLASTLWWLVQ